METNQKSGTQSEIELAMLGDQQAFSAIVKKNRTRVRSFILKMTLNPELADDMLQETWISAWKNISRYDGSPNIFPWLCQIAKNKIIDNSRKKYNLVVSSDTKLSPKDQDGVSIIASVPCRDLDPNDSLERIQHSQMVQDEIALALADRPIWIKLIQMRFEMDMKYEEIAQELNMNVETVRNGLHKAKCILRVSLSQ